MTGQISIVGTMIDTSWLNLLGNEDAGSGRVKVLGINTVDLVTSVQVGSALAKRVLVRVGQGNIESLHTGERDGALRATLLEALGRGSENIVAIIGGDNTGRRLISDIASNSLGETSALTLACVRRGVLVLRRT